MSAAAVKTTNVVRRVTTETPMPDEAETELKLIVPERFAVKDAPSASWVVRHVAEARAYAEHVRQWAEKEVRRARHEEEFFLRRFGGELEAWAKQELAKHKGRRKFVALPSGKVGFRASGEKLVLDDAAKVLDWARKHCRSAIARIEKLKKTALKQHLSETGELPDGAHLQPAQETFYIR